MPATGGRASSSYGIRKSALKNIPDELATLLKQPNIDVGTVIELKEAITKILKERGYSV